MKLDSLWRRLLHPAFFFAWGALMVFGGPGEIDLNDLPGAISAGFFISASAIALAIYRSCWRPSITIDAQDGIARIRLYRFPFVKTDHLLHRDEVQKVRFSQGNYFAEIEAELEIVRRDCRTIALPAYCIWKRHALIEAIEKLEGHSIEIEHLISRDS